MAEPKYELEDEYELELLDVPSHGVVYGM